MDDKANVVYERKFEVSDNDEKSERLYIPLNNVLLNSKSTMCNFSDVDYLFYLIDLISFANDNDTEEIFTGSDFGQMYSLSDLNASYYTGEVKRGSNYSLIPITISPVKIQTKEYEFYND